MTYALSEGSDQPGHPPSLIGVSAERFMCTHPGSVRMLSVVFDCSVERVGFREGNAIQVYNISDLAVLIHDKITKNT